MSDPLESSSPKQATIQLLRAMRHLRPVASQSHPRNDFRIKRLATTVDSRHYVDEQVLIPVKSGPRGVVLLLPLARVKANEDQLCANSRLLLKKIYTALEIASIIKVVEAEQGRFSQPNSDFSAQERKLIPLALWKWRNRSGKNLDQWLAGASWPAKNEAWRFGATRRRTSLSR